jgi:ABC-type transport system involved in cytochrome c biogenesis permease component
VALLFQAPLRSNRSGCQVILSRRGTVGFAAVGTLFAAMLVRARTRDVLLPSCCYPITVPVIIAGVRATAAASADVDMDIIRFWLALLVCFDVVFVTLALWTFEPLMTD